MEHYPSKQDSRDEHVSVARRIARAHAQIRELLDRTGDGAPGLEASRQLLEELPGVLREHFDDEEKAGGLYEALAARRPSAATQLESLRGDHRSLLRALEGLEKDLERLDATGDAAVQREAAGRIQSGMDDLSRRIRQHERAESRLTADILYFDEGGGG